MGSALKSQVTFGDGFPFATQVKLAEEPGETSWFVGPTATDAGSVEERRDDYHHEDQSQHPPSAIPIFVLPRTFTV